MGMIPNSYLITALVLACLALGAAGKLLHKEIKSNGATSAKLAQSEAEVNSYLTAIEAMKNSQISMSIKLSQARTKYSKSARDLEDLKHREETVLAKKGLVTIKINKAFTKQQTHLACLTGDTTACPDPQ
jgi:hypothetical protein